MNKTIIRFLPEASIKEIKFLEHLCYKMEGEDLQEFLISYKTRRRKPEVILIMCAIGFFGVAGIHRLHLNNVFLGVLYFATCGFCLIGTIIDIINHKELTNKYNREMAYDVLGDFSPYR